MRPTNEQLDRAIDWVKSSTDTDSPAWVIFEAYLSEKQDADDLEKYVAELVAQVNKGTARKNQLTHLLNMVNRVTCNYRHGHGVKAIAYQDMDTLCEAQIAIEEELEQSKKDAP